MWLYFLEREGRRAEKKIGGPTGGHSNRNNSNEHKSRGFKAV